jgi:DNA-binding CsgD family transcriptional regulator/FtsZ-binding cell division protein ZapB
MLFGKSLSLEKKISNLLILIGLFTFCFNFFGGIFYKNYSLLFLISHPSIYIIFIGTIMILLCTTIFPSIEKISHIIILFVVSFIGIMDLYNSFYGLGQTVLAILLMYKYGFFLRKIRLKIILIGIFYFSSIEASILISDGSMGGVGIEILIYTAFFIFFLYLVYQNEIEEFIRKSNIDTNNVEKLKNERMQLNSKIKKLEKERKALDERIQYSLSVGEKFDLNQYNLTKSEIRVVEILIYEKKSNKDIAHDLCVSENTIKTHLYNIYIKIGVGTRGELIGMFNPIKIN